MPAQGATISGTVAAGSGAAAGLVVGVSGTALSATSDGAGNFSISNVPPADVVLTFAGPGVSASASVGVVSINDLLHVDVTINGAAAVVDAQQKTGADNSVTADGAIGGIDKSSHQFTLGSTLVDGSAAAITRAGVSASFGDLANGDRASVRGMKDGGLVRASQIDAQANPSAPPSTPGPTPSPDVSLNGALSNLAGTCPSLTMTVAGGVVKTNGSTAFNNRVCSELKNGDAVYAIGPKQSDGSVLASKVYYTPPPDPTVTLTGTASSVGGNWPAITFAVQGTAVKTSGSTTCDGTKGCSLLANGDSVTVVGTKQSDGSVLASKVTNTTPPPTDQMVTLTGTVSNFGGAWPVLTLTVQGKSVKTSSSTTCDGTKGCSEMANGDSVTVVGTLQSDGSVLASKITNATPPPPTDTYVNGAIAGLAGTCPSLSMTVGGTAVKTNAGTTFNGRACAELKNGDVIYAAGPKQTDGTILANRTYYSAPTVTLTGTVSNFGGTWPVLTLTVQGKSVKTSSSTTCDGTKGCSQMANGDSVTVVGTTQSDGSVLASKITNQTAPPPADTYANGPIVGLAGTCPAVSFSLSGTPVKTSSATTFNGRACAELKNGDVIYAAGPKQTDGSILATRTYYTPPTVTLTGTVSNFGGTWPVLTFSVQGSAVKTSSSTTCDGTKGCSLMATGDSVTVVGTTQSDGSVLASKVTNATPPPPADTTLNGVVAALAGACPAQTMTVGGAAVKTTSATIYTGGACADVKNGVTVYAIGPKQTDGTVLASKIYFAK